MSVASRKKTLSAWRKRFDFRHYGLAGKDAYSLGDRVKFAATSVGARAYLRMVTDTCRWITEGNEDWRDDVLMARRNFIFLLWHNRVPAFVPYCASMQQLDPLVRFYSIVSASKDGELLARPIRESGGLEIRGSSSRDASKALRESVRVAREGGNILTVGDGPRGPRYKLKPGPVMLAKATGLPIVPLTWAGSRVLQFHRSWDQLMLPLPFTRVRLRFGKPFRVPTDADSRGIARARRDLERRLMELTEWSDRQTRIARQVPKAREGEVLKRRMHIELKGRHFIEP